MRSRAWSLILVTMAVLSAIALASCGGDDEAEPETGGQQTEASPQEKVKVGWLIFGPINDGGFAELHYEALQAADNKFGDRVEQTWADNVPFSEEATQITEGFVADGAKLLIDTGAIGDLFLKVCEENPDLHCIEQYFIGELPENVTSYYTKFWNQQYLLGVAAGHLTESETLGFAAPFEIPLVKAAINAWVLGCQSVRPDCEVRIIWINTWYDPPKSNAATNSLIDAGADVVNSFVSDPGYCQVAEERGVWAIGLYTDWSEFCPNAYANTMVWDFRDYFSSEVELELNGEWTGGRNVLLDIDDGAGIGPWGAEVPEEVRAEVEAVQEELRGGTNVFVGPIYDQKGKLRVPEGEELSDEFLYSGWDWLVKGVIGRAG